MAVPSVNLSKRMGWEQRVNAETFCCATKNDKVLQPYGSVINVWNLFVILAISIASAIDLYMAFFNSYLDYVWAALYIAEFLFLIDIILRFYIAYEDHTNASLIKDRRMVVFHYLKTTFALDIMTLIPLELFALLMTNMKVGGSVTQKMIALRMTKLIRFSRISNFFDTRQSQLGARVYLLRGLRYTLICAFVLHSLTGMWYQLACPGLHSEETEHDCYENSWASLHSADMGDSHAEEETNSLSEHSTSSYGMDTPNNDHHEDEPDDDHHEDEGHISSSSAYITAIYWTVATTTSTGYGDITATNVTEKLFSVFAMLVGMAVFVGMVLGGLASMLTVLDQQRANFFHKFNVIGDYLHGINCDEDLKQQVIGYYEYVWSRRRGESTANIYKDLPDTFVAEISYATYKPFLDEAHIFDDIEPGFLRMVSLSIHSVYYLPNQIVVGRGDVGDEMFYILHGQVEVLSDEDDSTPVAPLLSGKLFGELNLMVSLPRTATVRAVTHCDILCLKGKDLKPLLKQYPHINSHLKAKVQQRLEKVDVILQQKVKKLTNFATNKSAYILPGALSDVRRSFAPSHCVLTENETSRSTLLRTDSIQPNQLHSSSPLANHRRSSKVGPSIHAAATCVQHNGHTSPTSSNESVKCIPEDNTEESVTTHTPRSRRILMRLIKFNFNPDSVFIHVWQTMMMVLYISLCFLYPYMSCFLKVGFHESSVGKKIMGATYLVDLMFLYDILLKLRLGIKTPHGTLTGCRDIVGHYICSRHFVLDMLSLMPIESFTYAFDYDVEYRLFVLLKMNRILRGLYFNPSSRNIASNKILQDSTGSDSSINTGIENIECHTTTINETK